MVRKHNQKYEGNEISELVVCITGDIDSGLNETIDCLKPYLDLLAKYDIKATFPVTAKAVVDFPERINYIVKAGHELAGHGDVHKGFYGSVDKQICRMNRMINLIYEYTDVEITGFRAPWYMHDKNTYKALNRVGLKYDSSQKKFEIAFKGVPHFRKKYLDSKLFPYSKPFLTYIAKTYNSIYTTNGYVNNNVLELPVLGISDFTLIEAKNGPKYKPNESIKIGQIWNENLKCAYRNKSKMLIIQAHPGRMSPDYLVGLEYFIIKGLGYGAEFLTLNNISELKNTRSYDKTS